MTRINVFESTRRITGRCKPRRVSRRGKDLAAVIPIEDLHLLERLAQQEIDRIDLEDARQSLKEAVAKGTTPLRDLMRELGD